MFVGSDPFLVLFWKRGITHEPWKEPLDGIGCFPVPSCVQVISEIPQPLFIAVCLFQGFSNLFLVFLGDILQNRP